ncbi:MULTISPECIES: DUF2303 family protein [unclassified Streptomyces]|uniref:DUF2303 family protein n=1 Tax=unclassified Streptomyces TaxID=2593676 RepID=UPI0036E337A3
MTYTELASTTGEAQTIVDTAVRTLQPHQLEPGKYYAFNTPNGIAQVDLTGPAHTGIPPRKSGTTIVRDARSWTAYFTKHSGQASEVYSDSERLTVTAVLNAHGADEPSWGDHRLRLELRTTDAWKQWMQNDGQLLDQEAFAEFLEDHLPELLAPTSADMLEIAQSLQATSKVDFQSGVRLTTGQRQFQYVETTTTKAGQKGQLTVPETFVIGLIPFEGSEGYKITARLRYRITDRGLRMGYRLERPADVLRTAFGDVVNQIDGDIEQPILNGTPA